MHVKRDPRINVPALRAALGTFPKSEAEQNGVWYKLYKSIQSEPAVTHAHKEYLFTRDWTTLAMMMVVVLAPLAFWQATTLGQAAVYVGALVLQYIVVRFAAVNYGQRLVTTVLAIKSAGA